MWPKKKKLKLKKKPSQRHIGEFGELMGEGGFLEKKLIYKGANQTENFTEVKIRNDIYYRGEKHY